MNLVLLERINKINRETLRAYDEQASFLRNLSGNVFDYMNYVDQQINVIVENRIKDFVESTVTHISYDFGNDKYSVNGISVPMANVLYFDISTGGSKVDAFTNHLIAPNRVVKRYVDIETDNTFHPVYDLKSGKRKGIKFNFEPSTTTLILPTWSSSTTEIIQDPASNIDYTIEQQGIESLLTDFQFLYTGVPFKETRIVPTNVYEEHSFSITSDHILSFIMKSNANGYKLKYSVDILTDGNYKSIGSYIVDLKNGVLENVSFIDDIGLEKIFDTQGTPWWYVGIKNKTRYKLPTNSKFVCTYKFVTQYNEEIFSTSNEEFYISQIADRKDYNEIMLNNHKVFTDLKRNTNGCIEQKLNDTAYTLAIYGSRDFSVNITEISTKTGTRKGHIELNNNGSFVIKCSNDDETYEREYSVIDNCKIKEKNCFIVSYDETTSKLNICYNDFRINLDAYFLNLGGIGPCFEVTGGVIEEIYSWPTSLNYDQITNLIV